MTAIKVKLLINLPKQPAEPQREGQQVAALLPELPLRVLPQVLRRVLPPAAQQMAEALQPVAELQPAPRLGQEVAQLQELPPLGQPVDELLLGQLLALELVQPLEPHREELLPAPGREVLLLEQQPALRRVQLPVLLAAPPLAAEPPQALRPGGPGQLQAVQLRAAPLPELHLAELQPAQPAVLQVAEPQLGEEPLAVAALQAVVQQVADKLINI